ncbi:hypothetical protein IOCL2690_000421300 [Leishmania lindenbergi]|uniref:Uncharacterized protein n=1 Tax=Leishmania lindenbergi TaxID=651832 RepID=A0AAW3AGX0_9TRYP
MEHHEHAGRFASAPLAEPADGKVRLAKQQRAAAPALPALHREPTVEGRGVGGRCARVALARALSQAAPTPRRPRPGRRHQQRHVALARAAWWVLDPVATSSGLELAQGWGTA